VQDLNGEGEVAAAAKASALRPTSTGLGGVEVRSPDFIIFLVLSFRSVLAPTILKQKVLEPGSRFSSGWGTGDEDDEGVDTNVARRSLHLCSHVDV
jgi:hypothetical protein